MSERVETMRRCGQDMSVIKALTEETLGALGDDPEWFSLTARGWSIKGNTATARLSTYLSDGMPGPERYTATLTIARAVGHEDYDGWKDEGDE